jgi:hypothetical protein
MHKWNVELNPYASRGNGPWSGKWKKWQKSHSITAIGMMNLMFEGLKNIIKGIIVVVNVMIMQTYIVRSMITKYLI